MKKLLLLPFIVFSYCAFSQTVPVKQVVGAVPDTRTISINGQSQSLSANRSFSVAARDFVNIKDYGAVSNDGTSDVWAINAAIATGKPVYIPSGLFNVDTMITLPNKGQYIFGDGDSSILKTSTNGATTNLTTAFNIFTITTTNVTIEGVNFVGNGKTTYAFPWTSQNGVWFQNGSNTVKNCSFKNLRGTGVLGVDQSLAIFNHNNIFYCRMDSCTVGIFNYQGSEYQESTGNVITNCDVGIREQGANNKFVDNNVNFNGTGIQLYGNGGNTDHSTCIGSTFNHNSKSFEISAIGIGYNFVGCNFFFGNSTISESDNLLFQNCAFGSLDITVTATTAKRTTFSRYYTSGTVNISNSNTAALVFIQKDNLLSSTYLDNSNSIEVGKDSLSIKPVLGIVNIDSLQVTSDTTSYKPVAWNSVTGSFRKFNYWPSAGGGGSGTVTSVNITQPAAGITASGGPVTTSGSITLALANDLAGVEGLSANGIATRTATDTWTTRAMTGTTNKISITNGDGVSGNPTFTVGSDIVQITQANTYGAGLKQIFASSSTTAGLSFGGVSSDPSSLSNFDVWFNSTTNLMKYRANGTTRIVANTDEAQTFTSKTIDLASNTLTTTLAQLNTAVSGADVASLAGSETLTNKTINLDNNTVSNIERKTGVSLVAPTASEQILLLLAPAGGATAVSGVVAVRGTSPSITFAIHYGTTYGTSLGTIVASNTVTTTGAMTIGTPAIPANAYVWLVTTATSGTVTEFTPNLKYKY